MNDIYLQTYLDIIISKQYLQINIIHLKFHDIYIKEIFYDELILVDCNYEIVIIL